MIHVDLANLIATAAATVLRPASDEDLERLRKLALPAVVVDFYRSYEPSGCAEIEGVRLWPISEVLKENQDYVPGADVSPHGFLVFATTVYGDAYCFDVSVAEPRVVLRSHELPFDEMDAGQIKALAKPIAPNLDAFLASFAAGSLDSEPLHDAQS